MNVKEKTSKKYLFNQLDKDQQEAVCLHSQEALFSSLHVFVLLTRKKRSQMYIMLIEEIRFRLITRIKLLAFIYAY